MSNKQYAAVCETTNTIVADHTQNNPAPSNRRTSLKRCSVRELETISSQLRHAGKHNAAERIDARIMVLLEKKIYQKIIAQNRRRQIIKAVTAA